MISNRAAKVIENVQRYLNIALENELFLIFNRMGLDTTAVLGKQPLHRMYMEYPHQAGSIGHPCKAAGEGP